MIGMLDAVEGTRRGPLVVFIDPLGGRHAVRISAVIVASDADNPRTPPCCNSLGIVPSWFACRSTPSSIGSSKRRRCRRHVAADGRCVDSPWVLAAATDVRELSRLRYQAERTMLGSCRCYAMMGRTNCAGLRRAAVGRVGS